MAGLPRAVISKNTSRVFLSNQHSPEGKLHSLEMHVLNVSRNLGLQEATQVIKLRSTAVYIPVPAVMGLQF